MPDQPAHDPQQTVDQLPVSDNPSSTLDLTGAYHPAETTAPHQPAPPQGAPTIPGYAITAEIAKGGMGRVYAGVDLTLDREVAIKTLLPGADAERFIVESKITARLPHPGIPPVHALGTLADGTPFLAMKYVRGKTLSVLLRERASPAENLSRFVQVFEQIAQAVGFAHAQGIIHRDLKPLNVMVGEFGEVQVMDWGLAKLLRAGSVSDARTDPPSLTLPAREDGTQAGTILGTPGYMAPEQARGEFVDARADVFALGSILAAILTGKPAFVGTTARESIDKAAHAELAEVLARLEESGADAELIAVAKHCLAAQAADRPAEARAVALAIAEYRAGVEARLRQAETARAAALVREAEQRKRRRVLTWSAAAVATVLLVGTVVSLWQANAARTSARNAAHQKTIADEKAEAATQAEAATAAQLVKTQEAEAAAKAKTKEVEATLVVVGERTKLALEAFNEMVFGIQNKLENHPGTQDLRKELLTVARIGLTKILDEARKQGRPDSILVSSHLRLGDVELNLGNTLAAQKEYQAGYDLAKTLAEADPKNAVAQRDLGVSYTLLGDVTLQLSQTKEALDFHQKSLAVNQRLAEADPKNAQAQRDLSVSYGRLGNVTLQLGQTKEALDFYQKSLDVSLRLAEADPKNAQGQRDLGVSYSRLGDVTLQLGQTKEALDFHQKSLAVNQRLAEADPKNAEAQRNLGVSYSTLGDVTLLLGQTKDALDFYQKGLDVTLRLAEADPKNAQAQLTLGVSYTKLGDVTLRLGQTKEALDFYQKGLDVSLRLAEADPKNVQAQSYPGVSYMRLGDVTLKLGQTKEALDFYQKSLDVSLRLAEADPKDAQAQRTLGVSYSKLGDVTQQLGQTKEALDFCQKSLDVSLRLAEADPKNAQAQRDLSVSYNILGDVTLRLGQTKEALDFYQKSLDISQRLAEADPKNAQAQRDLSVSYNILGAVTRRLGQTKEALDLYQKSLDISQRLAEADPKNADAQTDLFISYYNLGNFEKTLHQYGQAAEWFAQGRAVIEPLQKQNRLNAQQKNWPSLIDMQIATCRNAEQAIADLEFAFTQKPEAISGLLDIRVKAMLARKKPADASATAERFATWAETQEKDRDGQRYNAACAYAQCAADAGKMPAPQGDKDRDTLIEQAVAMLEKAKANGYFTPTQIAHIKQDSDFAGIRQHPKFAEFVAGLEKK